MTYERSALDRVRARSLRWSIAQTALLSVLPALAAFVVGFIRLLGLPPVIPTPEQQRRSFELVVTEFVRFFGHGAVGDRSWTLPTLLALLIALYVGDYGQRRRTGEDALLAARSGGVRRAQRRLALVGEIVAAFTANYIALGVLTAVITRKDAGTLISIIGVGVWIVIFGCAVGTFDVRPPGLQLVATENDVDAANFRIQFYEKFGSSIRKRWGLRVGFWLVVPLLAAGGLRLAFRIPVGPILGTVLACAFVVLYFAGVVGLFAAAAAFFTRIFLERKRDNWPVLILAAFSWMGAAVFAIYVSLFATDGQARGIVVGVVGLAASLFVAANWATGRRTVAGRSIEWTPGHAMLELFWRAARRWRYRLSRQRLQIIRDVAELEMLADSRARERSS